MAKIVLISCVKSKKTSSAVAQELYTSSLFRWSLEYAKLRLPDKIYILSAEYHLLELDERVDPYEKTLNNMSTMERRAWANIVLSQLREKHDLDKDTFIVLAGDAYREYLLEHMPNHQIPMLGLGLGMQLQWLKKEISKQKSNQKTLGE